MAPSSHAGTAASAVVLNVGGKAYAFGLRWTSTASRGSLLVEAEIAAKAEGANYVALHRGFSQFGLAAVRDAPLGLRSATWRPVAGAAAIADAVGTATLAAFPLEDGRWLVLAIDRKGILPDGDLVLADEGTARARVDLLIAQSPTAWRRKYLPAAWGIPDAKTVSPRGLLGRSRAPRLVSLWLLIHRRPVLVASVALAMLLGAGAAVGIRLLTVPPPVAQAPFQAPKPVAAAWTPAGLAIDRCLATFRDADGLRAVPGWVATKYSCQGGVGVTVSLSRTADGQISLLRAMLPAAELSDDGRSATLSLPMPALPRISATAEFASRRRYQLFGLDLAQRLNGTFVLQAARKLLPGESATQPPNQAWRTFDWTYQTQAPPVVWANAIARLGSVAIDTVTYSPVENLWQLTGSLYASN